MASPRRPRPSARVSSASTMRWRWSSCTLKWRIRKPSWEAAASARRTAGKTRPARVALLQLAPPPAKRLQAILDHYRRVETGAERAPVDHGSLVAPLPRPRVRPHRGMDAAMSRVHARGSGDASAFIPKGSEDGERLVRLATAVALSPRRRVEAAAIRARRHAEQAEEGPPHHLGAPEAALRGDGVHAVRRLLEAPARALDARALDEARRRETDLAREHAREVPLAHRHLGGEGGHGEIRVEVIGDPGLQLAQRVAVGRLHGELGAELRLAAGALQEHDQLAGDAERELAPVVLLDEREGQVHAGGDAGRGVDAAVVQEDRVALDGDLRVPPRQLVAHQPVRGGPPAVEQPGLGQEEGPTADR